MPLSTLQHYSLKTNPEEIKHENPAPFADDIPAGVIRPDPGS
jgi:hypothetical protein